MTLSISQITRAGFFAGFLFSGSFVSAQTADGAVVSLAEFRVCEKLCLSDCACSPLATDTISAERIIRTVNLVDTEDALKYSPSIFIRKRNQGDTQPTVGTRVWGVSSSARSLVYADGVILSALVANNNSIGAPRWGMVAPAEIERIDVMHGPFLASFPGNSLGAVVEISTRMPERMEGGIDHTHAWQSFSLYGTHDTYATSQTSFALGDRAGKLSFWVSANYQDSESQPLGFVTVATFPGGTSGGFGEKNKFGQTANVVGASGLLHTQMANAKLKLAYDFSPQLRAAYTLGYWSNNADSTVETYLRDASGRPTFAGLAGFASGRYDLQQRHMMQSLSLKAAAASAWEIEASASLYQMKHDEQRLPTAALASDFANAGRVARLDGTGWITADLKTNWRPEWFQRAHTITFGVHADRYSLRNPTYNTSDWRYDAGTTSIATEGDGKTQTQALWVQDTWRIAQSLRLTVGSRFEKWHAFGGYNASGATTLHQPEQERSATSPKATVSWSLSSRGTLGASIGQAYRFATPAELYQLVSTGTTFTAPNSNLKPDDASSIEFKAEYAFAPGRARLSVFEDNIHDAIISQYSPLVANSSVQYQFISNVDHVRARGIELAVDRFFFGLRQLELSGSVTFLDARTMATQGRGQFGSAIGKRLPNIPDWRATMMASWRVDSRWTATVAGRYSGSMFTTLDQADVNPNTYQGFGSWFVADARVHCRINERWSAAVGADNFLNRKYFLFHPFPQRTGTIDLKYTF